MTDKTGPEVFDKERALQTITSLRKEIIELNERIKIKDNAMDEVISVLTYLKVIDERIKAAHKEAINHLLEAKRPTLDQVRLNIVLDRGLPIEIADRLTGETPEELEASADKLLSLNRK